MGNKTTKAIDFEAALQKLTTIAERMEQGDLPLEETIKQFEQAMRLIKTCQKQLAAAEQKVQILTKSDPTDE